MRLKEIENKPVVDYTQGRILGSVARVSYDMGSNTIDGVYFRKKGIGASLQYSAVSHIRCIGEKAVIVEKHVKAPHLAQSPKYFRLYDDEGAFLGDIYDIIIDERGRVRGVEISKSLYEDLINGREIIASKGKAIVNQERVTLT